MRSQSHEVYRERLDDAGVEAHLGRLAREATELEIRIKDDGSSYSDATADDVAEVTRRLLGAEIHGVQVRYLREGEWWCDTVIHRGGSYRLVRTRQP
jgi:hypothetical protein